MVETLLSMARMESGQVAITRQTVALDEIVSEYLESAAEQVNAKHLKIQFDRKPCELETDANKIDLVIRNILDNAITHSLQSSAVAISTSTRGNQAELTVTNTAQDSQNLDADQIFERFWQADSSRHSTGSHFGLGLPLSRKIVEFLNGK
ncbi:MAG: K+-sensing histidine kinase KdpD, partial [Pirellulaceae bacterium]